MIGPRPECGAFKHEGSADIMDGGFFPIGARTPRKGKIPKNHNGETIA
ncbi:hypothetical protein CLV74_11016 [Donghicola tyrosinivorans]|uniref:Uncharacterized protein n=1 Tax=Donghicola tyrosinivorans TaxID=1652492 RepID=A0A2T0WKR0_9RHOB|nr:hypothetical protein CLV74_11016 [Donghicola tyrosinivorans]